MRTFSARSRMIVLGGFVGIWGILAACSVEDENPATTRTRGTGSTLDASPSGEGGSSETPKGAPLCGNFGGADGIANLALDILGAAGNDCRISPAIGDALNERPKNSRQCFTMFVQSGFQCPGISFSLGQTKDTDDETCNSQLPGVKFSNRDFNAFLEDVKKALETKGLNADQVRQIAPVFEGARLKLVVDQSNTKHRECAPSCATGGEACIRPIPDGGNKPDTGSPQDSGSPPQDSGSDPDAS